VTGYATQGSSHAYRGFSSVRIDTVVGPDGARFTREVVEHPDAVAVVAIDDDGRVALVEQYRQPLGARLIELPAGTLDVDGEGAEAAAHRELAEEVGLAAARLDPLGVIWNSAGWSDERTHLYLARGLETVGAPDGFVATGEEADLDVRWMPLSELVSQALDGRVTDAKTVIGALRADALLRGGSGVDRGDRGDHRDRGAHAGG
jgi:8-oxo-dGDP phosphatase